MRRSIVGIILALALGCLVAPRAVEAQQPVKVHRIGVMGQTSAAMLFSMETLRQGLREQGYVEGRNLTLEYRWAEGRPERLADLAAELVRLPVDLIMTHGTSGARAARQATTTLPIVMVDGGDLVEAGIVESLARPGGNVTGSFISLRELEVKRLELLKEALPGVTRVAVLLGPPSPTTPTGRQRTVEALERTARELGVALQLVEVHGPDDFERALSAIAHGHADALVVSDDTLLILHAARIRDFVVEKRLPTIGAYRRYLIAYEKGVTRMWRRGAVFVDKILHGARPGDLPMERGAHFELMIDLKMAQELGVTISESLLMRADKVFPVSGVPLPASVRIVPPDRRIAPGLAAFSGKWFGTWERDRTQELILIVEAIDPPQALVIVAWGNGTAGAGVASWYRNLSDWFRVRGQFVEGTLQVSHEGGTGTYRLQPDGTLAATLTRFRETSRTTMTRAHSRERDGRWEVWAPWSPCVNPRVTSSANTWSSSCGQRRSVLCSSGYYQDRRLFYRSDRHCFRQGRRVK